MKCPKGKNVDGVVIEGGEIQFNSDGTTSNPETHHDWIRARNSRRKGMNISQKQFEDNWDRIFRK